MGRQNLKLCTVEPG